MSLYIQCLTGINQIRIRQFKKPSIRISLPRTASLQSSWIPILRALLEERRPVVLHIMFRNSQQAYGQFDGGPSPGASMPSIEVGPLLNAPNRTAYEKLPMKG